MPYLLVFQGLEGELAQDGRWAVEDDVPEVVHFAVPRGDVRELLVVDEAHRGPLVW